MSPKSRPSSKRFVSFGRSAEATGAALASASLRGFTKADLGKVDWKNPPSMGIPEMMVDLCMVNYPFMYPIFMMVFSLWLNSGGWLRNPNHQLKTVVNIPLLIGFQPSFWWCRISQPSTEVSHINDGFHSHGGTPK